jgi:hypothetical protein
VAPLTLVMDEYEPYGAAVLDVLVDLAAVRGARLDFMLGENERTDTLRGEFGGIAGLTRF